MNSCRLSSACAHPNSGRRAERADMRQPEVPFALERPAENGGIPRLVEGVIDLAFREADGWVIVDYKTDVGDDPDFPHRRRAYRRQVDLYAECWQQVTGEPVKVKALCSRPWRRRNGGSSHSHPFHRLRRRLRQRRTAADLFLCRVRHPSLSDRLRRLGAGGAQKVWRGSERHRHRARDPHARRPLRRHPLAGAPAGGPPG